MTTNNVALMFQNIDATLKLMNLAISCNDQEQRNKIMRQAEDLRKQLQI